MKRPVVHWGLLTGEPARLSAFYEKVFDWRIPAVPDLDDLSIETGGGAHAGLDGCLTGSITRPQSSEPWPAEMTVYIVVDDLAEYSRRIVDAGGRILIGEREAPDMGLSFFTDPDGRIMGLWNRTPAEYRRIHSAANKAPRRRGEPPTGRLWKSPPVFCDSITGFRGPDRGVDIRSI